MNAQNIGSHIMSKYERWYQNQNEATRAWLDSQYKEDSKLIIVGMIPGFFLGVIVTIILLLL